jgi:hypothetical protein
MALSYAQRRFLHQNPSFIHNLQSDARAQAGAARGLALEAERQRSGGGYYQGNAWISPGGADEQAAEDQQDEAARQVNTLRDELTRQGQIVQSGSYVYSPEEIRQRQEVSQASLAALDSLSPFVQSGMVDAETIRKAVGQVATDSFNDQRNKRRMEADLRELSKAANREGGFSVEQVHGVMDQMVKEYGHSALLQSSLGAKFLGMEEQVREEQNKQRMSYAEKLGVEVDAVVWDERNNRAVLDSGYASDAAQVAEIKRIPQELDIERRKIAATGLKPNWPDRRNYRSDTLGGAAAADEAYKKDLQAAREQQLYYTKVVYGEDSKEYQLATQFQGAQATTPTTPLPLAGDVQESTPQDLTIVERMVKAGLKSPGVYIGLDGRKATITGE